MKKFTDEEIRIIVDTCSSKELIGDWERIAEILNEKFGLNYGSSAYRKPYQSYMRFKQACKSVDPDFTGNTTEIDVKIRELQKERYKLQSEKLENNRWLRENARDELITEKIINAVGSLEPLEIPDYIQPIGDNKSYLLCLSDCHYGIEFEIKDLFGNVINSYSPEIFERRMWQLMNKLIEIIDKENITELNIFELGDAIQGIIRLNSQLMQLRYGVIDSAIKYGEFLATWLNELSHYVRIKFQMSMDGNHSQLRLCGAPKNSFPDENMEKVIFVLIKGRLENNPNIKIIENPTGMNYAQLNTYTVLGCHGEVKSFEKAVDEFSRSLKTPIDYLVTGHVHHSNSKEVGIDSEVLTVRSMIGADPYGMSLRKTSNAGASLYVFEQGYGKTCEYSIKVD